VPAESISPTARLDAEPVAYNGGRDRLYRIRDLGGETQGFGSAFEPRHHRALRAHAGDFRFHSKPSSPAPGASCSYTGRLEAPAAANRPIYGYRFEGSVTTAGDKLGFLKATVEFALRRRDLGGPFREYLKGLKL